MSKDIVEFVDRVVDASMAPASKAMAPVYATFGRRSSQRTAHRADAALRRLEAKRGGWFGRLACQGDDEWDERGAVGYLRATL